MAKCELCKSKIQEHFLKKMLGTIVKDAKGKRHHICQQCQAKMKNNKEEILKNL